MSFIQSGLQQLPGGSFGAPGGVVQPPIGNPRLMEIQRMLQQRSGRGVNPGDPRVQQLNQLLRSRLGGVAPGGQVGTLGPTPGGIVPVR